MERVIYCWTETDAEHMGAILIATGRTWLTRNRNGELLANRLEPFRDGAFWIYSDAPCVLNQELLHKIKPWHPPVNIMDVVVGHITDRLI